MKYLFFLLSFSLVLLLAPPPAHAQTAMTASKSTHTNADTSTHTIDLGGDLNNYALLTVQVVGTKNSGTPGGSAVVYGSLDGTNYKAIGADTLTVANQATNFKTWSFSDTRWRYYQVKVITSGTQSSSWAAKVFGRRQPK